MDIKPLLAVISFLLLCSLSAEDALTVSYKDVSGNLYGDSNRKYLDIISVEMLHHSEGIKIIIKTHGDFPNYRQLLGSGLQLELESQFRQGEEFSTKNRALLSLDNRGWRSELISQSSDGDAFSSFDFSIWKETINVVLPGSFIEDADRLLVDLNSKNFPKWKPVSGNPAIIAYIDGSDSPE
jgi:hypothetical protein